jgi:hypothetical protein
MAAACQPGLTIGLHHCLKPGWVLWSGNHPSALCSVWIASLGFAFLAMTVLAPVNHRHCERSEASQDLAIPQGSEPCE